jgi:hypothetical protein
MNLHPEEGVTLATVVLKVFGFLILIGGRAHSNDRSSQCLEIKI